MNLKISNKFVRERKTQSKPHTKSQKSKFSELLKNKLSTRKTYNNSEASLAKCYKFETKDMALQYVKNKFDFKNCTYDEYNKGMKILAKNNLLSKDEFIDWGLQGCIRNAPKIQGIKITNPVYLKFMSDSKQNWFENIKDLAHQQIKSGNPYGKSFLESLASLKRLLK